MTALPFRVALVAATIAVSFGAACAQTAPKIPSLNERNICPGVQVFGENIPITLMKVVSTDKRVHFREDDLSKPKSGCPSENTACLRKGFVVPGDEVLAGWSNGAYRCVAYLSPNAKRVKGQFPETNGYVPVTNLQPVPVPTAKPGDWVGKWSRSAEADIEITALPDGALKVAGQASYGSADPGRVARGAINVGEMEGERKPQGNLLAIGEDYTDPTKPWDETDRSECRARLQLIGRYLVVEDNVGCGGANVSFTGIYIRLK